ncbi:prephenate dehydrogenase [Paralcaligenes ureilyticus]|uniref:Prephenate dehydrogenase n=1 Tax=Paralcaligenes ureilyticus TaxID=627131 RepID=A0A4R3M1Y5_9BURK|nr:prephenate dehydrogenase/arogenate dehydrogenase family protein [Paralcaligenes ureilyticus]TCT07100.1 prephenate dehydrogenase [Paralcaligenes ureilyticus]
MSSARAMPDSPAVGVLAVIGVGLIGGSFAAALRSRGAVGRVLGVGRHAHTLERARQMGLIDEAVSLQEAAGQADLIVLATPVGAMGRILAQLKPHLRDETLITDTGSTKASVVAAARAALGERIAQFVPAHPIAGAEATGPEAANAVLYQGRVVVLTPLAENTDAARQRLTDLWEGCGARVMCMTPEAHDVVLASVSHVPHFLASVFMGQVAAAADSDRRLGLAGSGFRDFTRIAAGSPEMWRDIFLANRAAVLSELQEVKAALLQAEQALQEEDGQGLHDFLERAALARRFWGGRSGLS